MKHIHISAVLLVSFFSQYFQDGVQLLTPYTKWDL